MKELFVRESSHWQLVGFTLVGILVCLQDCQRVLFWFWGHIGYQQVMPASGGDLSLQLGQSYIQMPGKPHSHTTKTTFFEKKAV